MWLSIRQSLTWKDTTHVSGCSLLSTAQCSINAIILNRLVDTLHTIGQHPSICNWILDLLISCSQNVRLGKLSPLLYALFTYGCKPIHNSNTIARFADNVGAHIRRWPRRLLWILGLSRSHTHVHINTEAVERAPSVRFHHYRWPQYLGSGAYGTTKLLLSEEANQSQPHSKSACQLLQMHHREHPDKPHGSWHQS